MLIPKHIDKDDVKFFIEQTRPLPIWELRRAMDGYDAVYLECIEKHGTSPQGKQIARTTANIRLRKFVSHFES